MSRKYSKNFKKSKRGYKKESITQLAYRMGLVERGLNNPDSLITEAHNRGKTKVDRKRKPLF